MQSESWYNSRRHEVGHGKRYRGSGSDRDPKSYSQYGLVSRAGYANHAGIEDGRVPVLLCRISFDVSIYFAHLYKLNKHINRLGFFAKKNLNLSFEVKCTPESQAFVPTLFDTDWWQKWLDIRCLHRFYMLFAIHPIQNRSGMGCWGGLKSLRVFYLHDNPNNLKSSTQLPLLLRNRARCGKKSNNFLLHHAIIFL